jgi:hypothetical protein
MVVHASNPNTWETEAGGSCVWGQLGAAWDPVSKPEKTYKVFNQHIVIVDINEQSGGLIYVIMA